MTTTFTCAVCKGTFDKAWSDDESLAEFKAQFGRDPTPGELGDPVCDDCYVKIMARANTEGWKDEG